MTDTAVFITAVFFMLIFSWQWLGGTRETWLGGNIKGGDLTQHYVAGLLWNENRSADLYRDFSFSSRLARWEQSMSIPENRRMNLDRFNYVYPPLTARIAALFSSLNFEVWVWAWLAVMLATTAGAWILLSEAITGSSPSIPKDWFLLLSFPSLWLTFIPSQNSTISLFLISAAGLLATRGHTFGAGAVLACAFYKPQLFLCVGLILLVAAQYRFVVGLLTGVIFWLAVQLLFCGFDLHVAWIRSMAMSMGGRQFQWVGLNQSWCGWFLSIPGLSRPLAGGLGLGSSLLLMISAGLMLRKLGKYESWKIGHHVFVAAALWTVASPHTVYYDFLLILGLWAICSRFLPDTSANMGICFLGWLTSLLSAAGAYGFPWLTAPLATLWMALALASTIAGTNRRESGMSLHRADL